MSREPILGRLDPDLACAIACGFVEHRLVVVTPEAITVHDPDMRPLGTLRGWLACAGATEPAARRLAAVPACRKPRRLDATWVISRTNLETTRENDGLKAGPASA